jgi:protein-disulfide isomerase
MEEAKKEESEGQEPKNKESDSDVHKHAVKEGKDSSGSKDSAAGKPAKHAEKSERAENIAALSIFFVLCIIVAAIFTSGFGLFKNNNTNERFNVPVGNDPFRGNTSTETVLIIAFSDYQCPFCKEAELTMRKILKKYPSEVIFIFKDFPLTSIHKYAYGAALAAECAREQGKYWEYHDYLFDHNDKLEPQYLKEYARFFNMSGDQFDTCLDSEKYKHEIELDKTEGMKVGVSGTPVFFINGLKVVGTQPEEEFIKIINNEIANPIRK